MNCTVVRDCLPDLACDALTPTDQALVAAHLRDCAACRRAVDELRQVRSLLDVVPTPAVRVDVGAIYRAAAAGEARRLRRWRRLALAACTAAAALLLLVVGRFEVRVEAHQLVVRWQAPPAPPSPLPAPVVVAPVPSSPSPDEWRVVNALLQALDEDAKLRDVQVQQDVARLSQQIDELQRLTARRWASAEQDIRALYTAQFSTGKGANP